MNYGKENKHTAQSTDDNATATQRPRVSFTLNNETGILPDRFTEDDNNVAIRDKNKYEHTQETETGDQSRGFSLPLEFLERSPSHITVRKLTTTPDDRFNTFPNLQKEFHREQKRLEKSKVEIPVSSPVHMNKEKILTETEIDSFLTAQNDSNERTNFSEDEFYDAYESFSNEADEIISMNNGNVGIIKDHLCIECIKPIQVQSPNEVHPGDHISFPGATYDHHAIVVNVLNSHTSDDEISIEIVHATNTSARATLASLHPFGNKARLRHVEETINFREKKIMVYKYSIYIQTFQPNDIVARAIAESKADSEGGERKFKYNVFKNNCEHFATWCVTGRKLSIQERKVSMIFWMFLSSGLNGISDEFSRNEKEYQYDMLCDACYKRNKRLLDIRHPYITEISHVSAGDIITYSYYNLWHAAVVLEITDTADNYIICDIAHYAFCGLFKQRTIIRESIIIPLNGSVKVARYPEQFNVYKQSEVVDRAISRLGEQQFAFFSNDSSQFARWCKLKLERKSKA